MGVTYRFQFFAIFNYNRRESTARAKGTHSVGFTDGRELSFDRRRFICGRGSRFEGLISKQDKTAQSSEHEPDYPVQIGLFHHFKNLFFKPERKKNKCGEQHIRNVFSVRKMKEKCAKTSQHALSIGRIGVLDREQAGFAVNRACYSCRGSEIMEPAWVDPDEA